jgi:hypothetical protein
MFGARLGRGSGEPNFVSLRRQRPGELGAMHPAFESARRADLDPVRALAQQVHGRAAVHGLRHGIATARPGVQVQERIAHDHLRHGAGVSHGGSQRAQQQAGRKQV